LLLEQLVKTSCDDMIMRISHFAKAAQGEIGCTLYRAT
jgi:hypothetical protein